MKFFIFISLNIFALTQIMHMFLSMGFPEEMSDALLAILFFTCPVYSLYYVLAPMTAKKDKPDEPKKMEPGTFIAGHVVREVRTERRQN